MNKFVTGPHIQGGGGGKKKKVRISIVGMSTHLIYAHHYVWKYKDRMGIYLITQAVFMLRHLTRSGNTFVGI